MEMSREEQLKFEEAYNKYIALCVFIANKYIKNNTIRIIREDFMSDIDYAFYKAYTTYKEDSDVKFSTYLATVVDNECRMRIRRYVRENKLSTIAIDDYMAGRNIEELRDTGIEDTSFNLEDVVFESQIVEEIIKRLGEFDKGYTRTELSAVDVFITRYVEGLTIKQLREKLKYSTIQSGISRFITRHIIPICTEVYNSYYQN